LRFRGRDRQTDRHVPSPASTPRSAMRLADEDDVAVADAVVEDSGNYTCEVRGHKSTVLSHVTHALYVRCTYTSYLLTYASSYSSVICCC